MFSASTLRTAGLTLAAAWLGLACCIPSGGAQRVKPKATPGPSFAKDVKPLVKKYCVSCHSGSQAAAGLNLQTVIASSDFASHADAWAKVATRLGGGTMPPKGMPAPTAAARKRATLWIADETALRCKVAEPGHVTIRRLNRAEYDNTIRDLTGLDVHPSVDFPSDDVGYGFDNIGEVLSTSSLLMEKYLNAAEDVATKLIPSSQIEKRSFDGSELKLDGPGGRKTEEGAMYFSMNAKGKKAVDLPHGGEYKLVVFASGDLAGPDLPRMEVSVDGKYIATFQVSCRRGNEKAYQTPVTLPKGIHDVDIAFTNDYYNPEAPKRDRDRNLFVRSFELDGPTRSGGPSDAELRVIPHEPTADHAEAEARTDIAHFALRAFRRPPTNDELDRLMKVYDVGFKAGKTFDDGMRTAVEAILVSPQFLYRVELAPKPGDKVYTLNDYELASRLSYFLWSSMPDDKLLALAGEGRLHETSVLNAQVQRMIEDPKAQALADNFAGQWLQLRKLAIIDPNPQQFPGIDDAMKKDMATETEMFFNAVLRENRPITDFINGHYTYIDDRLAKLYGIEGVTGHEFRRVALTGERGGVLTQASVLTVTSNPTRTSPTKRGKWVLENILGTPPPPPPPGVGVINDEQKQLKATTLRALMEEHRKNPMCAACHAKMDPIGFGLENFDAVGRWRTTDGNFKLDTTGVLPDGRKFNGPAGLKAILLQDKKTFAHALADRLLTYALGRGLTATDACSLDGIVTQSASRGYRFADLVAAVVDSDPFRKQSTDPKKP